MLLEELKRQAPSTQAQARVDVLGTVASAFPALSQQKVSEILYFKPISDATDSHQLSDFQPDSTNALSMPGPSGNPPASCTQGNGSFAEISSFRHDQPSPQILGEFNMFGNLFSKEYSGLQHDQPGPQILGDFNVFGDSFSQEYSGFQHVQPSPQPLGSFNVFGDFFS